MAVTQNTPAVATPPQALVPFIAAAHEQTAQMGRWVQQSGASAITLPSMDIPAGGFLRSIFCQIDYTGGVGGTLGADAPWSILDNVQIKDVNGAPLFGPLQGYQVYAADQFGGYRPRPASDTTKAGSSASAASGRVFLRIPVEIDASNGIGSLPNQLSNATYALQATLQPTTAMGSGYTTAPTFTITLTAEFWTQPAQTDDRGRPQEQNPPRVGTTQNWTVNRRPISVGGNQTQILRVGNVIRKIICIARDAGGVRNDAVFPDPVTLYIDGVQLRVETQPSLGDNYQQHLAVATRPNGVFVFDFSYFGEAGFIGNDALGAGWLPTSQGTRLEIQGNSAVAGTLDIITNDVLPAEIVATDRFDQRNAGGFKPAV